MGTLRTLLALTVVLGHVWTGAPWFVGGENAVQLFFVISGFLISFVLVEGRTYARTRDFYVNRALRLYPVYAAVAVLALCTRGPAFFELYRAAPGGADVLLALSNAFLFGQDWVMFTAVQRHALVFPASFWDSEVLLWRGLLVPQAWSLGLELTFYLLAPVVLPRRRLLYGLLGVSLACWVYLRLIGVGATDPWSYRFFPAELWCFLLGALAHQHLLPIGRALAQRHGRLPEIATAVLVVLCLAYRQIPGAEAVRGGLLLLACLALLPFTFLFQHRHRWDDWIGSLSYPIYIGHMLVIEAIQFLIVGKIRLLDSRVAIAGLSASGAVLLAMLLNTVIGEPVEKLRARWRAHGARQRTHVTASGAAA